MKSSSLWRLPGDCQHARIKVVTMGGTIANLRNADGSAVRIPIAQVISNIRARYPQPEVRAVFDSVEISEVEVTRVGSGSLNLNEFLGACREAQKAVDEGYDGIIVTHGTTTSEDTVYFLNLLVGGDIPIVLTNSQIQHMSVGNDGDMNLLNAIMVASARSSRERPCWLRTRRFFPHAKSSKVVSVCLRTFGLKVTIWFGRKLEYFCSWPCRRRRISGSMARRVLQRFSA